MPEPGNVQLRNIVVIGASAGGVEALQTLFSMLPANLHAAFFVVLHTPPSGQSILPELITRAGGPPAEHATDNTPIIMGRVYVAPPDFHMILQDGSIRLNRGAKENRHRPAIDPLFRSAALVYGSRSIGIILSGTLDDGTSGLAAIKDKGGITMVQHPGEALFTGMPLSALRHVAIDHSLPVDLLAKTLVALVGQEVPQETNGGDELSLEMRTGNSSPEAIEALNQLGKPSAFTCPECHGTLWEITEGNVLRFRCHVGHAYSAESLSAELNSSVESSMWSSLRALEEAAGLAKLQEAWARKNGDVELAGVFKKQQRKAENHVRLLKDSLKVSKEE